MGLPRKMQADGLVEVEVGPMANGWGKSYLPPRPRVRPLCGTV